MRELLQAGADTGIVDLRGRTALHLAAAALNLEVVDLLLESGADFEARDTEGNTALMLAEAAQAEAAARTPGQERSTC